MIRRSRVWTLLRDGIGWLLSSHFISVIIVFGPTITSFYVPILGQVTNFDWSSYSWLFQWLILMGAVAVALGIAAVITSTKPNGRSFLLLVFLSGIVALIAVWLIPSLDSLFLMFNVPVYLALPSPNNYLNFWLTVTGPVIGILTFFIYVFSRKFEPQVNVQLA